MLFIVGVGINAEAHVSTEAKSIIAQSTHVYYLLSDDSAKAWVMGCNPNTTDLSIHYKPGINRRQIYDNIVQQCDWRTNPRYPSLCGLLRPPRRLCQPGVRDGEPSQKDGGFCQASTRHLGRCLSLRRS